MLREDNQAAIKIIQTGYSAKLRHLRRTHKINLATWSKLLDDRKIENADTVEQLADLFTKAASEMDEDALCLLGSLPILVKNPSTSQSFKKPSKC